MSKKPTSKASTAKKRVRKKPEVAATPTRGPGQPPKPIDPASVVAFAAGIEDICEIFGVAPADLVGRNRQVSTRDKAIAALRKLAFGAVATLGRDLGFSWGGMISDVMPDAIRGAHKTSLGEFHDQFGAWTGLNIDGRKTVGEPAGQVAAFVRDRYLQIKRDAMVRAAGGKKAA